MPGILNRKDQHLDVILSGAAAHGLAGGFDAVADQVEHHQLQLFPIPRDPLGIVEATGLEVDGLAGGVRG